MKVTNVLSNGQIKAYHKERGAETLAIAECTLKRPNKCDVHGYLSLSKSSMLTFTLFQAKNVVLWQFSMEHHKTVGRQNGCLLLDTDEGGCVEIVFDKPTSFPKFTEHLNMEVAQYVNCEPEAENKEDTIYAVPEKGANESNRFGKMKETFLKKVSLKKKSRSSNSSEVPSPVFVNSDDE